MQIDLGKTIKCNVQSVIGHPEQTLTTMQVDKVKVSFGDDDDIKNSMVLENVLITLLGDDSLRGESLSDEVKARIDSFTKD